MPMALDPNATFDVVLRSDAEKPAGERPTFEMRFLSCRQWREIAEAADRLDEAGGGAEVLDRVVDLLGRCVGGWRQMTDADGRTMSYTPDCLADVLTMSEAQELLQRALEGRPDGDDLKNSPSPAASPRARSAKTAPGRNGARSRGKTPRAG